jgi:hypothetical protein
MALAVKGARPARKHSHGPQLGGGQRQRASPLAVHPLGAHQPGERGLEAHPVAARRSGEVGSDLNAEIGILAGYGRFDEGAGSLRGGTIFLSADGG